MANTLDNNQTTIDDGFEFVFGTTTRLKMGQYFKAGATGPFSRASASLAKSGSPTDNLVAKIYSATLSGTTLTIGSLLGTSTTTYAGSSLPSYPSPFNLTTAPFVDFDFDGTFSQTAGNYYLLDIERTGSADDTNKYVWGAASSNADTNGSQVASDGSGNFGSGDTGNPDQTYRTYYDPNLTTTTSTSSSTSTSSTSSSTSKSTSTSSTSSSISTSTSRSTSTSSTSSSISTSSTSSSISTSSSTSTSISTSTSQSTSSSTSTTIMALDIKPVGYIRIYR